MPLLSASCFILALSYCTVGVVLLVIGIPFGTVLCLVPLAGVVLSGFASEQNMKIRVFRRVSIVTFIGSMSLLLVAHGARTDATVVALAMLGAAIWAEKALPRHEQGRRYGIPVFVWAFLPIGAASAFAYRLSRGRQTYIPRP